MTANLGWLLFDKLIRSLLGLLVGAWVARYLGPAGYGTLSYVVAFVALFTAIATLSADSVVVRDIAQDPAAAAEILGSAFVLRLALGSLCWVAVVGSVAVANPDNGELVAIAAIVGSTLVFQAAETVDLWFQSQSQSRLTVIAKLSAYLASNGVKVVLIMNSAPIIAFAWVAAFDALACAAALSFALRKLPTTDRWHFVWSRARRISREVWPFVLSGLSIMVYSRVDQILIKQLLDERSVGIYSAALSLSQFWQVIPMALMVSLAPFMAKQKLADEVQYRRAVVLIFRGFVYLGLLSALVTWLVSDVLVRHLFGPDYAASARVLEVHAVSNVFCFLGIAHGIWLVNERRFAVRLYGTLLAGLTTVGLNIALLPRLGVIGAAYTAIVSQLIAALLINIVLDRQGFRLQCRAIAFAKG